jgi:hypothetical protein
MTYRAGGNISIDDSDLKHGKSVRVSVGPQKDVVSRIQYLNPLSSDYPYFYCKVNSLSKSMVFETVWFEQLLFFNLISNHRAR